MLPVPGPGFRGRFWPQAHCEQTKVQSQTARAFDPGFLGPDVGQFAMNSRPTPTHDRPQKPGPGTGTNNEQLTGYWKAVWPDFAWVCYWGLAGSAVPGEPSKKWGGDTPPHSLKAFPLAPGAGQTSKTHPTKTRPDCLQVPKHKGGLCLGPVVHL